MRELFLAELRHFRNAALIVAALTFAISYLEFRTSSFLFRDHLQQMIGVGVYLLAAGALALVQFGIFKQPSRWIWLMHRCMPRWQIFMAIQLATALLIALAVGVPLVAALFFTQVEHVMAIDARYYMGALHVVLLSILSWQCAGYATLAKHRFAFIVMLFPLMMMSLFLASAYVLLVPVLLGILLMGHALFSVFRPERKSTQDRPLAFSLAALPVLMCFYVALTWSGTIAFKIGFTAFGFTRPENYVAGGLLEAQNNGWDHKLLRTELEKSSDPRAIILSKQLASATENMMNTSFLRRFPVKDQAANDDQVVLDDENHHLWSFSHDRMQFAIRTSYAGPKVDLPLGVHGMNDTTRFDDPVKIYFDRSKTEIGLASRHALYIAEKPSMKIRQIAAFTGEESVASKPVFDNKGMTLVTNQRVVSYELPVESGSTANALPHERFSIPLPGPLSDLHSINTAEVESGTVVGLVYAKDLQFGSSNSELVIYHVQNGQASVISRRYIVDEIGPIIGNREFWPSPVVFALLEVPDILLDRGKVLNAGRTSDSQYLFMPRTAAALRLALIAMLFSGLMAWAWLRRTATSPRQRMVWIAACLILSLPGLCLLMAMQPRQSFARKLPAATLPQVA
jgi:hypothetical protein